MKPRESGSGILVIGGSGLLGSALRESLSGSKTPHLAPARQELDLRDLAGLERRVAAISPGAILNAAAFTDVAAAEKPESRDEVFLLNRDIPEALARVARTLSVPFVHVSTDYVFDGSAGRPYREDDPPAPLQVYGESKLQGEARVVAAYPRALVVRTSTLYGPTSRKRLTYVDAILAQALGQRALSVVELPVSSPTYAPDLAAMILALLDAGAEGIVHAANDGSCSRLELSRAIVAEVGRAGVVEVSPRPAPETGLRRPSCSALDTSHLESIVGRRPRPWREALRDYLSHRAEVSPS